MSNKYFILLIALISIFACKSVSDSDKAIREEAKQKIINTNAQKATPTPSPISEVDNKRINKFNDNDVVVAKETTSIQFKEKIFDYGTIKEGEKAKHTYTFTNTGTNPLIIAKAKGSCGCTVPSYSETPVLPGETGKIDVVFDSKGKPGSNSKTITITANTEPVQTILTIKGKVTPKKK